MCQRRKNGATPLDLAIDDTCREILEHHYIVDATITEDPSTLVSAALAHCAALSASEETLPATVLSLRAYYFDPCFLWALPAARTAVVAWALHVLVAQLAATIEPFGVLLDDCAGDVLEFFGVTHNESELIATHCSSPEARAWVCAVIAVAIVVSAIRSYQSKQFTISGASRILYTPISCSTLAGSFVTQEKASTELVPAAGKGDLATVQDCLSRKANIENKVVRCMFTGDVESDISFFPF